MNPWVELWDADNASLVGTYSTQSDALAVDRRFFAAFDAGSVWPLVLTKEDDSDTEPRVIASGGELAALAQDTYSGLAGTGPTEMADEERRVGAARAYRAVTVPGTTLTSEVEGWAPG